MAKKTKFHFNSDTLNYEPVKRTFTGILRQVVLHLFSGISLGILFFFIFIFAIDSPREKQLANENTHLQAQYQILDRQLDEIRNVLATIELRDNNLYRVILQAEPISPEVRRVTTVRSDYYEQLLNMTNSQIALSTTKKINEIRKQLYIQSKSYDNLVALFKDREKMLECIPAIQPVLNKDLTRMASGFGMRIHPIYHVSKFHEGMDFTAPVGTDIYATGNGTVIHSSWKQGYGNCVIINHGFGYITLYGHMSAIKVLTGQKVKRGHVIGLVGNTGLSKGPHLHYEVHLNGKVMNPMNYYFIDLSPEEYDKMVELSANSGQALD
ncbi:MAG: M23 family metallopeptidase [Paludibacter sp.]|jgi:murein DD-endopeptidase MepM/ murein hydrolase activator NlpD|nr:M23 family metallopeptidase [Paludibacter sp.]